MSVCLGAACKLRFLSDRLRKNASAEPSTKDGIEIVSFCSSLLRARLSIDTVSACFL
jgi:hypothetical protein